MINIKELLRKRMYYTISQYDDAWVNEIIYSENSEEWIVVPSNFIHSIKTKPALNAITEKYMIAGVYNLGSPFINTHVRFELLHLTIEWSTSIDIGIFKAKMFDKMPHKIDVEMLCLAEEYSDKYSKYIFELEKWLNEEYTPDHDPEGEYEYNTIPLEEYSYTHMAPEYYSRVAMDVRRLLKNEPTVPLYYVAEIIKPKPIPETRGKIIGLRNLVYPFDTKDFDISYHSTVKVQMNDILFPMFGEGKPYLVNEEINEDIYVSPSLAVIRCTNISPAYLFLYLNSEVCQIIIESLNVGSAFKRTSIKSLKKIPVIKPKEAPSIYESQVVALTHVEKTYNKILTAQKNSLQAHQNACAKNGYQEKEKIEDILNIEIANKIKVFSEDNLRFFLTSDLKELNDCFRAKAFKATLILAGSILEAVLIDWLSDIHGVNYFDEEYYVTKNGKRKRAELVDYINEIKYIERPHWMEEANKAHEIRKKRNLVHAKLCINSNEINESVCRQVIAYLRDVLKTRGIQ